MNPIAMSILLVVLLGAFAYSARRRWKLMMVGPAEHRCDQIGRRIRLAVRFALGQARMPRYRGAGVAHMLIFFGFCVLLLRSLILFARGFDADNNLWLFGPDQPLGVLYGLIKDAFVLLVIAGTGVFFYYRLVVKPPRLSKGIEGLIILGIIAVMMLADVLYDGTTLVRAARAAGGEHPTLTWHAAEPLGSIVQHGLAGLSEGSITFLQHAGYWTHVSLVLIFLNLLPYSKHFHVITAVPNVFAQSLDPPGKLPTIDDIEGKVEREETLGIRRIDQFSWKAILDFYTCTECGRCSDQCPAHRTGKKLSPKHLTIDLRNFLYKHESALTANKNPGADAAASSDSPAAHEIDLTDGVVDPEVLWACTTCRACETECPVFITYVDKIVDMRRYLVQERGEFPNELQSAFRSLESSGNPWGFQPTERADWAEGLDVPLISEKPDVEYLFWVGCAPSFDQRAKNTARATAQLLIQAGVRFAILGPEEQCTGDPARRAGNEFLFQMLAGANCETLNGYGVRKIITTCPHCFNTLGNEYGDFGGRFEVVHHTELLAQLVRDGKIVPTKPIDARIAYHDSCYLGRYNEIYDAPRDVLRAIPGVKLVEPVETRDRGMCCGAGGAQMFKEEEPGSARVNHARVDQLTATRPDTISSACPFCMRMLTDGLADKNQEKIEQKDIAELLLDSIGSA